MQHYLSSIIVFLTCASLPAQSVVDPNLRVNKYVGGFDTPTGVAFLDANGTALVTEKNTGLVKLVENRAVTKTVLDLPVATDSERGLLSVALSPNFASDNFVYFFHTAARADGGAPISNKISRYRWNPAARTLTFERKIIDLPGGPGPNHDGGKIAFAPNGKLFAVIGDLNRDEQTTNFENTSTVNRVAGIIRVQPDGRPIASNPFPTLGSARTPQQDLWAYGIRNSFGIAFDPVTSDLWDTENGPDRMDEINRVTPGFNSGWQDIMGPIARSGKTTADLVSLGLRANYQDPKLSWDETVAPTDLEFFSSSRLGTQYRNDLFVGDVNTGSLYRFDLTSNRKSLQLPTALADRVVDDGDSTAGIVFGSGFGVTSDIVTGPGGMFVLSLSNGTLYRISENPAGAAMTRAVPEPMSAIWCGAIAALSCRLRRRKCSDVKSR
ncbi:MAG: PQQ-dependent sugar dehydrogenase [Anaerolineae bacterium]|nr:PQQ-dependent sugar dehydrogenase [Phycisphaerae bacterium]